MHLWVKLVDGPHLLAAAAGAALGLFALLQVNPADLRGRGRAVLA